MNYRNSVASIALALALCGTLTDVRAQDVMKYPTNWKGQWTRVDVPEVDALRTSPCPQVAFDATKPWGLGQDAPLTPEYQKVLEESMADQAAGGLGNYPTAWCFPSGMPRMMTFGLHEYVITPETTFIVVSTDHLRRIFTDGRDWPKKPVATYGGYTIGKWVDTDGDGTYDRLETETRYFKGPRAYDASGLPLHFDNQSVFKEWFFVDKNDILHDLTTVIDNALTRPWTSDRQYRHVAQKAVQWPEFWCQDGNANVIIGKENYWLRTDGLLMPSKPNQVPPDLRYFKQK